MLKRIEHKLANQRGASLSMALMLFLVVTVVASVALTAATGVAGRQSQLIEMDKSYYNVTSAAKLFWEELEEGITVSVVRECDLDASQDPIDATWEVSVDESEPRGSLTLEGEASSNPATLFQVLSADLFFDGGAGGSSPADYTCAFDGNDISDSLNFESSLSDGEVLPDPTILCSEITYKPITITVSGPAATFGAVTVTPKRMANGIFEFVFTDTANGSSVSPFVCTVVASVGIETSYPPEPSNGHVVFDTTATWKAESIQVGGAR